MALVECPSTIGLTHYKNHEANIMMTSKICKPQDDKSTRHFNAYKKAFLLVCVRCILYLSPNWMKGAICTKDQTLNLFIFTKYFYN